MKLQIGFWVLVAFVLLLWATFQSGSLKFFGHEEKLRLTFSGVGNLEEGSTVRLNGVPVGHVRDIDLAKNGNDVVVELGVKNGTRKRLHRGSVARITSTGSWIPATVIIPAGAIGVLSGAKPASSGVQRTSLR